MDHIVLEETEGGIVLTLQAGIFEIFKAVLLMFYSNPGTVLEGRAFKLSTPRENSVTHTTSMQVQSNDQVYTVNLYHSQSRILVNGRNHTQFAQDFNIIVDFIRSQQAIGGIPVDAQVNEILKQHLEARLEETVDGDTQDTRQETTSVHTTASCGNKTSSEVRAHGKFRLEGVSNNANKEWEDDAASKIVPDSGKPLAIQTSSSTSTSKNSLITCKDKKSNCVIEDLTNVIQSVSLPSVSPNEHTQAHIPHRRAILQPPGNSQHQPREEELSVQLTEDGPATQDMVVEAPQQNLEPTTSSQAVPDPAQNKGETTDQGTNKRSMQNKEDSTPAGSAFSVNAHRVQLPPSSTIDLSDPKSEQAEIKHAPLAITDRCSDKEEITEGNRRRRGNKPEQEKPLDAAELRRREKSLNKKEEAVKVREKRTEQVEKDLAEARAYIIVLEARLKDEKESNRVLNQRILALNSS